MIDKKTITWHAWQLKHRPMTHPIKSWVKEQVRAQGYVGIPGIAEFLKEQHQASPIVGKLGDWNGIKFKDSQALERFLAGMPEDVTTQVKHMEGAQADA